VVAFKKNNCFCHSALDAESMSRGVLQYAPTMIDSRSPIRSRTGFAGMT